jgi:hypothetical protein
MWCAVELVRDLRPRQEVLGSNLTHHKRGLPIRSPGWKTGNKASSQPGLKPTYALVHINLQVGTNQVI